MKIITSILLLSFILFSCEKESVEKPNEDDTIYIEVKSRYYGNSNAVSYLGGIVCLQAYEPQSGLAGYPDPNSLFHKLRIIGSTIDPIIVESTPIVGGIDHCFLQKKPNGNLVVIYQTATGLMYGFDLHYKEYSGQTLVKDELIFTQANWGAWPRIEFLDSNDKPNVVSFAHAGYQLLFFDKGQSQSWRYGEITELGTYYGYINTVHDGQTLHISALKTESKSLSFFSLINLQVSESTIAQNVNYNCGLFIDSQRNIYSLFSSNGVIKLATKSQNSSSWTTETICNDCSEVLDRAEFSTTPSNSKIVAVQKNKEVIVYKKSSNSWIKDKIISVYCNDEYSGQGPMLVTRNSKTWLIFSDNNDTNYLELN